MCLLASRHGPQYQFGLSVDYGHVAGANIGHKGQLSVLAERDVVRSLIRQDRRHDLHCVGIDHLDVCGFHVGDPNLRRPAPSNEEQARRACNGQHWKNPCVCA